MIATERIIAEMERQLTHAKTANDEQTIREALTAISSLCQVVLGSELQMAQPAVKSSPPIAPQPTVSSVMSLDSKPFIEKDANGGSIFDF